MASNTRQLKRRIGTAGNISKITKAMEMVAASKMKKAQAQALASRAYSRALEESLHKVAAYTDSSLHPLLAQHHQGHDVLIVLSSDRGLAGALNTHLFKATLEWIKQHPDGQIIAVGKKAVNFIRRLEVKLLAQFTSMPDHIVITDILPISSMIMQGFLNREYQSVHVIYMDFINTLTQKVRTIRLLPIAQDEPYEDPSMVIPELKSEYIFEPSAAEILSDLLPYYLENTLYQLFLESKASEHSARMVAMKNASENANELVDELRLLFNKSRQAAITEELLDITTATLTLQR